MSETLYIQRLAIEMAAEPFPHIRSDLIATGADGGAQEGGEIRGHQATRRNPFRQTVQYAAGETPPTGMDRAGERCGPVGDEDGEAVGRPDADEEARGAGEEAVGLDAGRDGGLHPLDSRPVDLPGKQGKAGPQGPGEGFGRAVGRPGGPDAGSEFDGMEVHEFAIIAPMPIHPTAGTRECGNARTLRRTKIRSTYPVSGVSRLCASIWEYLSGRGNIPAFPPFRLPALAHCALLAAAAPFIFQVPPEFSDRLAWLERHAPPIYEHYAGMLGTHPGAAFPDAPLVVEVVRSDPRIFPWADGIYSSGRLVLRAGAMEEFPELFRHELAHAFIEAAGGGRVAVWFNEGLAMRLSGGATDPAAAFWASVRGRPRLQDLAASFPDGGMAVRLAYARSHAVVGRIADEAGWEGILAVLHGTRRGLPFDQALLYGTGRTTAGWDRAAGRPEWVGALLSGSGAFLWFLIAAVVVVAYIRLRRRRRAVIAGWEEDEHDDPDVPRV